MSEQDEQDERDETGAPRPGTKADLEARLAATQRELELARGQLAEARAGAASPALVTFAGRPQFRNGTQLSEGERQALEINGVVSDPHGGGLLLASDFGVEVITEGGRKALEREQQRRETPARAGIPGVDYVYPSVAPGVLAEDAPVRGAVVEGTPQAVQS